MLTLRASICCTPSWSPSRSPSRRARPASAAFAPRGPRTTPAASRFDRWQTASSAYGGWYQPPPPSAFGRPVPPTTDVPPRIPGDECYFPLPTDCAPGV